MTKLVKLDEAAETLPDQARAEEGVRADPQAPEARAPGRIERAARTAAAGAMRMLGAALQGRLGEDFYDEARDFADRIEGARSGGGLDDEGHVEFESLLHGTEMLVFEEALQGLQARISLGVNTRPPGVWAYELEVPAAPGTKLFEIFEEEFEAYPEWQEALARGLGLGDKISAIAQRLRSEEFAKLVPGATVASERTPRSIALMEQMELAIQDAATYWQRFLETSKKLAGACDRIRRTQAARQRRNDGSAG